MKRHYLPRFVLGVAMAGPLVLAGCETAPETSTVLEDARSAVSKAESNPGVTQYAAAELDRARKLLVNAEGRAEAEGARDPMTAHYAYLATQMAHIAEQRANEQVAIARVKSGEAERQRILLTARETEAQRAQADAERARSEAANAQAQAANAQAQVAQATSEAQRLAALLENMEAEQTKRGIVLTLDDVLFDTGRSELKPSAARSIDQIASFLNENPERRVQVEGFTDSQGGDSYNRELSQRRADAVAMAIIQRGIDAQRVRALGYGEEFPVASNDNAGSRQLNRRVEIIVSNDEQAIPGRATGNP
jgi:outer membrane protein OmpA-like peptidoglycan-associated protein